MVLDELGDLGYLTVVKDTPVLEHCVAVVLDKELSRATLGEFAIAGMDVHTFHNTEGSEIKVITCYLEIIILRHDSVLHIF